MDVWPAGYGREVLEQTGSTMDDARAKARAGEPGPVWIMAKLQTGGRGRRGNAWKDPGGNMAATLLIRPRMTARESAQLTFVSALAVADLAGRFAPAAQVALKWPNDVLVEGGKIAGILLESEGQGAEPAWVSIGIGVNLASRPPGDPAAAFPPISFADLGVAVPTPEQALDALAAAFAHWLERYRAEGFAPLRDAFLARAARLGQPIVARLPKETIEGVFADLDEDGRLVLDTPQGARRIAAADVFFP
ncbi:biotin--[acetyl-CoA-carboxylase] ligase [Albimonas sp. CAU 1670]|uniref:biotin--[acetyl-CoA-carboxylase] ligase n=1 Tax=Albimonas sp. CAU 1670 TaxID=3032599 RepID=UPI0023DA2DD4|nr:biotin--[acetyl-CoA-carboxylase] ligase [Albimonas sp. CAU 1670]MDF2232696.1 biotin--[acetyl-CoA-carboxylase] ligase [Albimonas sp. CAU 1670]